MGIKEVEFWEMTIDEVQREINGIKYRLQLKASMDYTLADLIGISVGRCLSKNAKMPKIEECYPYLFEEEDIQKREEIIQEREEEKQVQGFLTLAELFNKNFEEKQRGEDLQQAKN